MNITWDDQIYLIVDVFRDDFQVLWCVDDSNHLVQHPWLKLAVTVGWAGSVPQGRSCRAATSHLASVIPLLARAKTAVSGSNIMSATYYDRRRRSKCRRMTRTYAVPLGHNTSFFYIRGHRDFFYPPLSFHHDHRGQCCRDLLHVRRDEERPSDRLGSSAGGV